MMAAWRQKQWKFKNTTPKCPKKEEWVTGISASRLMQTAGNYIQASSKYVVFNIDGHGGGVLGVLPLDTCGHISSNLPLLYAHSNFVSDFGFSPHDDTLLATTSFDNFIKLWRFPDTPVREAPTEPQVIFPELPRRGDGLQWNPLVTNLMSVFTGNLLRIYDVSVTEKLFDFDCHDDVIQGASWSLDGSLLVTTSKDRLVRLFDPRSNSQAAVQSCSGHQGVKDSRIKYINENRFITTGFDTSRTREVMVYDARNLSEALNKLEIDNNNGTLIPLFDADTDMLYLAGKGDNNVRFLECSTKMPYIAEAACDYLQIQLKGACLIPKRSVNVMKGEVNRMLVLSKDCVVPVPYIIPRRSYAEFHADAFPDTYSGEPGCDVKEWAQGGDPKIVKISLDPAKGGSKSEPVVVESMSTSEQPEKPAVVNQNGVKTENGSGKSSPHTRASPPPAHTVIENANKETPAVVKRPSAALPHQSKTHTPESVVHVETEDHSTQTTPSKDSSTVSRQSKVFKFSVKTSKFRHLKGTPLHKDHRIENIRNLNNAVPGECNGFALNRTRCVISLKGPAGLLAVFELSNTGKLEDTPPPALSHGCSVCDFKWDPFNDARLVTVTESGAICVWEIPASGLTDVLEEPTQRISAHNDKIYSLEFHPLASDVLATSAQDFTVKVWNLIDESNITLEGHSCAILGIAWSSSGVHLATFSKDSMIRVYEPRASTKPIREGKGPSGTRGGRIIWVLNDSFITVSGFDRQSTRLLQLYDPEDLSVGVATVDLDTSPSTLIPHYDADSQTIFLTGKGDTLVQAYEVTGEPPYFQVLSSYHSNGQHQALAFLPKLSCDVMKVEFARAYRLTQTKIEPISFTVPRVKCEYFQDDLFPDTAVTWEAVCTAPQWFSGTDRVPRRLNLQPEGTTKLSDAPPDEVKERKYEKFDATKYKTDVEKRDELVNAVTSKLNFNDEPLPQELQEGVDSDEWDDDD